VKTGRGRVKAKVETLEPLTNITSIGRRCGERSVGGKGSHGCSVGGSGAATSKKRKRQRKKKGLNIRGVFQNA